MPKTKITCASCGKAWTLAHRSSIYEQQSLESRPCPRCGGYTLCCHSAETVIRRGARKPALPLSRN
jgi:ribosomal protein S27E